MAWRESGRRPNPHNAAERRRHSHRAAKIGALRNRHHPGRDRHRRSARRTGGTERRIPGVARRPEHCIDGVCACTEFRRIGFSQHDGSRRLQATHDLGVLLRDVILVERRAERGADAGGVRQILDRNRQPRKRTHAFAAHRRGFHGFGVGACSFFGQRHDRVEFGIHPRDHGEVRIEHLEGAHCARPDHRGQLAGGFSRQAFVGHRRYLPDQWTKRRSTIRNSRFSP